MKEKCTKPKAPVKDINLPPLQRQIGSSPTTFRAFRKITMRSEKEEGKVKKSSGHVTRPKVLLKDMRRPPLRREIDTSTATCLRIGVLTRRQVDRAVGRRPS